DYRWKFVPAIPFEPNPSEQLIDELGIAYEPDGEMPSMRVGHTVVAYQGKAYMWGGYCPITNIMCSKIYCFDPEQKTWSVIPTASRTPSGRAKHTAIVYDSMMFIYGGMENDSGQIPRERFQHTACVIDDKMYVYGGVDANRRELYLDVLNLNQGHWERPNTRGQRPNGVRAACSWVHNKKMYIFGGCRNRDERYIATLHRFDPETLIWCKIEPFGLNGPMSRERHCGVLVGDCAYVFSDWTLKDLAAIAVIRHRLNFVDSDELPLELRIDLDMMITRNDVL
ncbi:unnamed protein product, partial [Acanthocheilonema viteae]